MKISFPETGRYYASQEYSVTQKKILMRLMGAEHVLYYPYVKRGNFDKCGLFDK